MHILYFHANFTTTRGAWSTRAYDFARRWIEQGHRVTVVTGVYDRSDLRPSGGTWTGVVDGITVHALNLRFSNRDGFLRRVATSVLLSVFGAWRAARLRYDLALISCGPITMACAGLAARWTRRPVVLEMRDLFADGLEQLGIVTNRLALRGLRQFEGLCCRDADALVALSETMAEWLRRRHRVGPVEVVPNTADVSLFGRPAPRPAAMSPGAAHFLYTGTLGRANDCGQILRAARHLRRCGRRDIHFHLIGDGSAREGLEAEAGAAGLDRVHFHRPMPKRELARWVASATAMILVLQPVPVFDTVSPNKLFDAFAAGVPVIQTTQGWIRRVLADHDCGLTVDPGRPAGLAEAVAGLADDPLRRDRMARNARRVGRDLFETNKLADRMLDVMIAAHRKRRGGADPA